MTDAIIKDSSNANNMKYRTVTEGNKCKTLSLEISEVNGVNKSNNCSDSYVWKHDQIPNNWDTLTLNNPAH
jgi:hypothetical protein